MVVDSLRVDLLWALQILYQASFKFSSSFCLKLRTSFSGVSFGVVGLAIDGLSHTQTSRKRERNGRKKTAKEKGKWKRQMWSGGEENERQLATKVNAREEFVRPTWIDLDLPSPATAPEIRTLPGNYLDVLLPGNGARNTSPTAQKTFQRCQR